eukprot:gene19763-25696_t
MRVNRAKLIRKYIRFYRIIFRIEQPYNIILDGNFIYQCLKSHIDINERLSKLLQESKIILYTQRSIIKELELLGDKASSTIEWINKFCKIYDDNSISGESPSEKLINIIEQLFQERKSSPIDKRIISYFIASQDKELRSKLSTIPGTPLIYLNKVTLVMEAPSDSSRNYNLQIEYKKISLSENEKDVIANVKTKIAVNILDNKKSIDITAKPKIRVKRKPSAANPLSIRPASDGASAAAIDSIPLITLGPDASSQLQTDDLSCPICLNDMITGEQVRLLICKHSFHRQCVDEWLRVNATCPSCRKSILPDGSADTSNSPLHSSIEFSIRDPSSSQS